MKYIMISVLLGCILMDAVLGISQSKSCTMINGEWKCEEMTDPNGHSAGSVSVARSGPQPADFRHVATANQDQSNYYSSGSGFQQPYESQPSGSEPSGSQPAGSQSGGYRPQPDVFQPFVPLGPFLPYGASSSAAASSNQGQPSQSFASSSATHDAPLFVPAYDSQAETPGDHASHQETPVDHASHETGQSGPSNADGVTVTSTSGEGNFPGFFYPVPYAVPGAAFAGSGAYAVPGAASAGSGAWSGAGTSAGSGAWSGAGAYPGGAWAGPNFAGFPFGFGTYAIARRRR